MAVDDDRKIAYDLLWITQNLGARPRTNTHTHTYTRTLALMHRRSILIQNPIFGSDHGLIRTLQAWNTPQQKWDKYIFIYHHIGMTMTCNNVVVLRGFLFCFLLHFIVMPTFFQTPPKIRMLCYVQIIASL